MWWGWFRYNKPVRYSESFPWSILKTSSKILSWISFAFTKDKKDEAWGLKGDQACSPFDPVISQLDLPPTDSLHLWWDLNKNAMTVHNPAGVFKSFLTLLSLTVIPLIYYGMVIGWGVAMTQGGRSMNQVGQSISL